MSGSVETVEPEVDGYLIKLDDVPLDEVLQSQDSALTSALRDLMEEQAADPGSRISAFNNYI